MSYSAGTLTSAYWGSPFSDARGRLLERWSAQWGLCLINSGNAPTCVRQQGSSYIDTTWASTSLAGNIHDWMVLTGMESFSDHPYITFKIGRPNYRAGRVNSSLPRWAFRNMDIDLFCEVLEWACRCRPAIHSAGSWVSWINGIMRSACDVATRRIGSRPTRSHTFWWSDGVAAARRYCIGRRRVWSRAKRTLSITTSDKYLQYRAARNALRLEIRKAKAQAWMSLLASVEKDPWGLPYKLVMGRLRPSTPGLTASLPANVLSRLISDLFPAGEIHDPALLWDDFVWDASLAVEPGKVMDILRDPVRRNGDPAPGPDGVRLSVWRRIPYTMMECLAHTFTECLAEGVFPLNWKRALLVLIPKGSEIADVSALPRARPICLLEETGKILERILVQRMQSWMDAHPIAELADTQFGFRVGYSTYDALSLVHETIRDSTQTGGYAVAIGLDIRNAFNSIPWSVIRCSLRRRGFPDYIRRIIDSYLHMRTVEFTTEDRSRRSCEMTSGVPQGSVLGPLLWNLAFDDILSSWDIPGCRVVCYADDTLILSVADDPWRAATSASLQARMTLGRIKSLGLAIAPSKTEAVLFCGDRRRFPKGISILVGDRRINLTPKSTIRYLGVTLDARLKFEEHFQKLEGKLSEAMRSLSRLMPNLRGPREKQRRLYANVISSMALYGSPIWADALIASRRNTRSIRGIQRSCSIRMICAYRTVSFDAACLLAKSPPYTLLALMRKRVFHHLTDLRGSANWSLDLEREVRFQEHSLMLRQWRTYLESPNLAGVRTRDAIGPHFKT